MSPRMHQSTSTVYLHNSLRSSRPRTLGMLTEVLAGLPLLPMSNSTYPFTAAPNRVLDGSCNLRVCPSGTTSPKARNELGNLQQKITSSKHSLVSNTSFRGCILLRGNNMPRFSNISEKCSSHMRLNFSNPPTAPFVDRAHT